jgi:hypothetical protein
VHSERVRVELEAEGSRLRARVAFHKTAMRREREQLRLAAAALEAFERKRCEQLGIAFIVQE